MNDCKRQDMKLRESKNFRVTSCSNRQIGDTIYLYPDIILKYHFLLREEVA